MGIIDNPLIWFKGVLAGIAITIAWQWMESPAPDLDGMMRRVDGYRACLVAAGAMRCQMTPDDFVEYYDLRYKILQLNDGK